MGAIKKTETPVSLRIPKLERQLIKRAAESRHQKESEYIRESALKQAQMDLADKVTYEISDKSMAAFIKALERPARINPKLYALLSEKTLLD